MTTGPITGLTCDEVRDLAPSFVLGALEDAEMAAVRDHLAACPEAHAEMEELGGVVPYLAESLEPVEPPAGLKARIVAAAEADRRGRVAGADAEGFAPPPSAAVLTAAVAEPAAVPAAQVRWIRPRRDFILAAAAVLAIVVLGAWNFALRGEVADLTAYRQGVVEVLEAAAAPGSQLAILTADGTAGPRGLAALRADGTVVLAMRDLAPTSGTEVYETWLIAGQGAPVPVGGFAVGSDGTATFASQPGPVAPGAVVALTLEPGPGATTPTLPIVAKGAASPPPS